jgi:hypothetical protein
MTGRGAYVQVSDVQHGPLLPQERRHAVAEPSTRPRDARRRRGSSASANTLAATLGDNPAGRRLVGCDDGP